MKWLVSLIALSLLLAAVACQPLATENTSSPVTLRIAAAADLRFALDELTLMFRAIRPDVVVVVSYGSSGILYAQLVNHGPFDLFLAADRSYARQLAERGLTLPESEFTYAVGRIVFWVPATSPIDVERLGMSALKEPSISHVAIANPEHAPYGRAAEAALRKAAVYDSVKSRLVLGENVSQALQFVESGAADIGIVALSLALSPTFARAGRHWTIPPDAYPRIEQGGTILRWALHPETAWKFRSFILSAAGRAVLKRYGFLFPEREPWTGPPSG